MKLFLYITLFFGLSLSIHFKVFSNDNLPCRESESNISSEKDQFWKCIKLEDTIVSLDFNGKTYTNLNVAKEYDLLNKRKEIPYIKRLKGVYHEGSQQVQEDLGKGVTDTTLSYAKTKFYEQLMIHREFIQIPKDASGNLDFSNGKPYTEEYVHTNYFDKDGNKIGEFIKGVPFEWREKPSNPPELGSDRCYTKTSAIGGPFVEHNCPIVVKVGDMTLKGNRKITIDDTVVQEVEEKFKNTPTGTTSGYLDKFTSVIRNIKYYGVKKPILLYNENNEAVVYLKVEESLKFYNLDGTPLR